MTGNLSLSVSILSPNQRQNGDRMETNDFFDYSHFIYANE